MKKYDVIIIGAGPSGLGAAKVFNDNKVNYCIIEKNKFPREKLCGGGLTNKSITLLNKLNIEIDNKKTFTCKDVLLIAKKINRKLDLVNNIIMTNRIEFDDNNFKQIAKVVYEEENILDINDNILITNKDNYKFKYIIFADGVNGYSRKLINKRKFGFCVEYNASKLSKQTILDFNALDRGYGWIFPKYNQTNIGIGNFTKRKEDYISLITDFANKHGFTIDKKKIRGYHIPIFTKKNYKNSVIDNKYILVGDAASLVDPISGEGIYYALLSGKLAAESIIEAKDNNLKEIYLNKTKGICKSLNKRKKLSKLLYSRFGILFIKLGLSSNHFIKILNRVFG